MSIKYIVPLRYFIIKVTHSSYWSFPSAGAAVYLYWRKTRWVRVGEVTELYLFPLKGGQALSVQELECGVRGPRRGDILDRGFMIGTDDVRMSRL